MRRHTGLKLLNVTWDYQHLCAASLINVVVVQIQRGHVSDVSGLERPGNDAKRASCVLDGVCDSQPRGTTAAVPIHHAVLG